MTKQLLSKEAVSSLELRIQHEEFSSRLYEDMSLWFDDKGYKNLSKLYKKYSDEELTHAGWAKQFLLSYKIKPCLKPLQSPESEYAGCKAILEATLAHETMITKECEALSLDALKRSEMTLHSLGMKYCAEQIEEMDKAYTLLDVYALSTCDLLFDQYVGDNLL